MQKGGIVSFYYQSELFPVEKWVENDWELLNIELEKAIAETSNTLKMIYQRKSEEEIKEKIKDREIVFFQRGDLNCFRIKTYNANTGKKYIYREWYLEDRKCMNARSKLDYEFDEL